MSNLNPINNGIHASYGSILLDKKNKGILKEPSITSKSITVKKNVRRVTNNNASAAIYNSKYQTPEPK